MNFFFLLIFVVLVVAPLLERLRGQGTGTGAPPGRPPLRRPPYGQPPTRGQGGPTPADRESAADLLPEDLWRILTGQAPPRPPQRLPETTTTVASAPPSPAADEVAVAEQVEERREEAVARRYENPSAPLQVISLETEPLPAEVRHAAFQKRYETPLTPPTSAQARPKRTPSPVARSLGLDDRDQVRRAVLLHEILGPPKGLE